MLPKPLLPGGAAPAGAGQCDSWTIDPICRAAYETLFHDAARGSAKLGGADARDFFTQSGLPAAALAEIWTLADIDGDGSLDRAEFCVAMHLCRRAKKGVPVPRVLPRELVPESKFLHYNVTAEAPEQWTAFGQMQQQQQQRRPSGGQSQMPHFAMGQSATFEQRMQLEGELASALAGRRQQQQQ